MNAGFIVSTLLDKYKFITEDGITSSNLGMNIIIQSQPIAGKSYSWPTKIDLSQTIPFEGIHYSIPQENINAIFDIENNFLSR